MEDGLFGVTRLVEGLVVMEVVALIVVRGLLSRKRGRILKTFTGLTIRVG